MGVFQNNLMGAAAAAASASTDFYDYQITNSLRLNGTSQALERSFSSTPSNADAKAISVWIKRSGPSTSNSAIGSTTNTKICSASTGNGAVSTMLEINTNNPTGYSDQFHYYLSSGGANYLKAKWRDPSAWMHIVWIYNSDESTTTDRVKVYINGDQKPIGDTNLWDLDGNNGYPASGTDTAFGLNGNEMHIGRYVYDDAGWWGGQMADFIMIDGTASISDFGETKNGVWKPVDPSGLTFGTNGFWLDFKSASDPGNDASGNNNDFTNIGSIPASATTLDTPTFNSDSNGGNFATYNPLIKGSYTDLSEGNCRADSNTGADASYPAGTHGMISGKWYFEQLIGNLTNSYPSVFLTAFNNNAYSTTKGIFYAMRYRPDTGAAQQSSGDNIAPFGTITVNTTGVTTAGTGDIVSWYVDMDNKKAWFAKNGTIPNSGDPANGTNPQFSWTINPPGGITFGSQEYQTSYTVVNAGQDGTFAGEKTAQGNSDDTGYGNFYYDPPTGFLALCSGNMPISDAINPAETSDDYPQKLFTALAYSGDGGGSQTTGFQPDWVWVKARNTGQSNGLWDSTRGTSKVILSNETNLEGTSSGVTSFNTTGYTMGTYYNQSGNTYASWSWRANGGTTSTNTQGSEDSTVQVDPSGHFSIVKWTGTNDSWGNAITLGHGLSAAPNVMLCKKYLGNADQWEVFFSDYGNYSIGGSNAACNSLRLDTDAAIYTNQSYKTFGGVMPTSTVFTVDGNNLNGSGDTVIAYCFADCEGYIKSGTYEGNANADGSFLYTGFKPEFFMCKPLLQGNWRIQDIKRSTYNVANKTLYPNHTNAEESYSSDSIDILSNGVKMRASDSNYNQNTTFVFLAMSHNPLKYATAR